MSDAAGGDSPHVTTNSDHHRYERISECGASSSNTRSSCGAGRLAHSPLVRLSPPSDDGSPLAVRRKSIVRFLDEVTTIHSGSPRRYVDGRSPMATDQGRDVTPPSSSIFFDGLDDHDEADRFDRWKTRRKEREAKIEMNILWLQDEIVKLKQQDQSLMRQFLQLRSVIYQLKTGAPAATSTPTDQRGPEVKLPRIAASSDAIHRRSEANAAGLRRFSERLDVLSFDPDDDDFLDEMDDSMALTEDDYLPEFRNRTMSLLTPANVAQAAAAAGGGGGGGFGYLKGRTMSFSVGSSGRELDRAIIE